MYQYILFDLDGTLTDPKEGITRSVQYALHCFGIDVENPDDLTNFIGPPLIDSFMEYYGMTRDDAVEATKRYRERFGTVGVFENSVLPGIPEMLGKLREEGKTLAIATSKPEKFTNMILEHFDLTKYFDYIVGSLMNETRTDKAEVIEEALRQMHITPDLKTEVLMVGDRKHDLIGAHKNGLAACGVTFGYAPEGELEEYGAEYIVSSPEEFLRKFGGKA